MKTQSFYETLKENKIVTKVLALCATSLNTFYRESVLSVLLSICCQVRNKNKNVVLFTLDSCP